MMEVVTGGSHVSRMYHHLAVRIGETEQKCDWLLGRPPNLGCSCESRASGNAKEAENLVWTCKFNQRLPTNRNRKDLLSVLEKPL